MKNKPTKIRVVADGKKKTIIVNRPDRIALITLGDIERGILPTKKDFVQFRDLLKEATKSDGMTVITAMPMRVRYL